MIANVSARILATETILNQYAEELRRRPRLLAHKYVTLGRLYLRAGDAQSARRAMRRAIAVSPESLPAYLHLALSYGGWIRWTLEHRTQISSHAGGRRTVMRSES